MHSRFNRKTSPRVIGGLVQRKNNHVPTGRQGYVVDRVRPARGFRHVLKKKHIHDFTDIIPEWQSVCLGLEAIILSSGDSSWEGLYRRYSVEGTGAIHLAAWPSDLLYVVQDKYIESHKMHFDRIRIATTRIAGEWHCQFTESQARAYSLLHIFLHELGHHIDKYRGRNKPPPRNGENFAESYANSLFEEIWPAYVRKFGEP